MQQSIYSVQLPNVFSRFQGAQKIKSLSYLYCPLKTLATQHSANSTIVLMHDVDMYLHSILPPKEILLSQT